MFVLRSPFRFLGVVMLRLISCGCCGMPRVYGKRCHYCVLFANTNGSK